MDCENRDCDVTSVKHIESIRILTNMECVEIELTLCMKHYLEVMSTLYDNIQTTKKDK